MSPRQIKMHGQAIVNCVAEAMAVAPPDLPVYPRRRSPSVPNYVSVRVQALRQWRDAEAEMLGLDPSLLFNKATLGAIALERPLTLKHLAAVDGVKAWQKKAFGRQVVSVLKGTV